MSKFQIPQEATAVRAESDGANGYVLIFDTPSGEVKVGSAFDMERAVKLASKVNRILKKRITEL